MRSYNARTVAELQDARVSKLDAFDGFEETFDCALPQAWLDAFVEKSKLDYHLVWSTTVWSYGQATVWGEPVTCCADVAAFAAYDTN
jgi:hypothetical protein